MKIYSPAFKTRNFDIFKPLVYEPLKLEEGELIEGSMTMTVNGKKVELSYLD